MENEIADILIGKGDKRVAIQPALANRHGLVAGATGTGKSVTLKILAEGFSDIGVPVFLADAKGDLAGISQAGDINDRLLRRAGKIGFLLFQFPPWFAATRGNAKYVEECRARLPGYRLAVEFRHPSWDSGEVLALLSEHGHARCAVDTGEDHEPSLWQTADWGYVRLRGTDYGDDDLRAWAERIRSQPWRQAFVFFKHEEAAAAPRWAAELAKRCEYGD